MFIITKDAPYQILKMVKNLIMLKQHLLELCNTVDSEYDLLIISIKRFYLNKSCVEISKEKKCSIFYLIL